MAKGRSPVHGSSEKRVFYTYNMPFGKVTVASDGSAITNVALGSERLPGDFAPDAITNHCANQLVEYLSGKRAVFDVPIRPSGTDFQLRAWETMGTIPYSHTMTSTQLAEAMGAPEAYRMIGAAVRKNPIIVLIPAHRVVPSSGHVNKKDEHAMLRAAFRDLEQRFA